MKLIECYAAYKQIMERFEPLIETWSNQEVIQKETHQSVLLDGFKEELESMMQQVSTLEVEEENEQNLKDLKYLVADTYFLAVDLVHLYQHDEVGRMKLRLLNYLNKKRRSELFG